METEINKKKSLAKKVKILFKRQQGMLKKYREMANFEEPIALLIRRTGKVEFHDRCTSGFFEFKHSDGKDRKIQLSPEFLKTFDYGKRTFKGYILDEDRPIPLPESPLCTIETYEMGITKTLNDISKWKQKEYEGIGKMWLNIAMALGLLLLVMAVVKMMAPNLNLNPFSGGEKVVVQTIADNITNIHP